MILLKIKDVEWLFPVLSFDLTDRPKLLCHLPAGARGGRGEEEADSISEIALLLSKDNPLCNFFADSIAAQFYS